MRNESEIAIKRGEGNALTVIDAQNDFAMPTGALYVQGIESETDNVAIVQKIRDLWNKNFDYRATSEDRHPSSGHVEFDIFGPHCIEKTIGQLYLDFYLGLHANADMNLVKGQYASVIAYSIATSPQFADHIADLRALKIKRVFVVGWAYTHCVGESAIAYATQGFETYVIRDLTRSVPPPHGDALAMHKKLDLYGVKQILFGGIC